jgi:hypothetical protein
VGDARHAAAGEEVLEALLAGTDAEGFAGDRALLTLARTWLAEDRRIGEHTVGEAYRLRSADRVEALFLRVADNPRSIPGLPGRFEVGFSHAIEVTRGDDLAFRTSPCWRRVGGRGWLLFDPGTVPAVARHMGREALAHAQEVALERGLYLEREAYAHAVALGPRPVEVALALRATSLPRTIRERAAENLGATATFADVVVSLADVAGAADREEGETYARAAGRLLLLAPQIVAAVGAGPAA